MRLPPSPPPWALALGVAALTLTCCAALVAASAPTPMAGPPPTGTTRHTSQQAP